MANSKKTSKIKKYDELEQDYRILCDVMELMQGLSYGTREAMTQVIHDRGVNNSGQLFAIFDILASDLGECFSKSTKKSKMKKTPIVNLYGNDDTDTSIEIDNYNEYADVTAQEIEALAPSAEVIVDMGQVDVVWRLPSGNHPGLWITSHGKGRQVVHVSAKHFDHPDEENVSGFLDYIQDKYGRKSYELVNSGSGLPPEEIKEAISEMEQELGRYAVQTTMPIYNASAKKSKQPSIDISFEASVNSLRKTNYAKCGNINTIVKERK